MRPGNWDGLLPTGKTRQSTLSVQIPYDMQVHPTEPMLYSTSDKALKQEGEDARYDILSNPLTNDCGRAVA